MFEDQYRWHESRDDVKRQWEILSAFCEATGLTGQLTLPGICYDAELMNHKLVAYAEVKYRFIPFAKFDTYIIDCAKLLSIWKMTVPKRIKAFLIVSWQGEIRYAVVRRDHNYRVKGVTRKDRVEFTDDVYHIPTELFKSI